MGFFIKRFRNSWTERGGYAYGLGFRVYSIKPITQMSYITYIVLIIITIDKIEITPMITIVSNPIFADFTAAFVLLGYLSFCIRNITKPQTSLGFSYVSNTKWQIP